MRAAVVMGMVLAAVAGGASATPAATPAATATPPQATPKSFHTRLSRPQPRLGEPFEYEIELRHPASESYLFPGALDLAPFSAVPLGCHRAPAGEDSLTTCTLRLTLFELGARDVPTVRLEATTPLGPRVLDVPGPRVEPLGVIDPKAPDDQLQLRPPAAPVPLLLPSWRLIYWALGGLVALLGAVLLWRWWRRRARRAGEPPPPIPPDERFARRLDGLAAERLPEQGRVREYFFRLSEAVREYLGAITGLNALDLTTAELLDTLAAQRDPRLDLPALRGFSEDADLIKFARYPAGGYECEAGMKFARALLERVRAWGATSTATPTATATATATPGRRP